MLWSTLPYMEAEIWINTYLMFNLKLLSIVFKLFPFWLVGAFSKYIPESFLTRPFDSFLWQLSCFLVWQGIPGLPCTFLLQMWNQLFSEGVPIPLTRIWYLKIIAAGLNIVCRHFQQIKVEKHFIFFIQDKLQ